MNENKKIELSSRYNDVLTELEYIDSSRGIITTNGAYSRVGTAPKRDIEEPSSIDFVDFEGGPLVSVGSVLNGKTIKKITGCWLVDFE